jgi:hypothetical protein
MAEWSEGGLPQDGSEAGIGVSGPDAAKLGWNDLLRQTYGLYSQRFKTFFLIALPPAVVAYFCRFIHTTMVRAIRDNGWMPHSSTGSWWVITAPVLFERAIYFLLSAFLFAAVATYVLADETNPRPLADAYTVARERIRPILVVGLLGWTCFTVSRLIANFAVWKIVERFRLGGVSATAMYLLPTILICGLLSRLGLAIPGIVEHRADSLSSAVRDSVRRTENWEPFFMLFIIKSGIAAYVFYWLANRGLDWLWQRGILTPALDPWISRIVYISIAASLETPLFIAFSILFRKKSVTVEQAVPAAVG